MSKQIKPLSNTELSVFFEQMGMILNAGITPAEGISVMTEDAATDDAKTILSAIEETYNGGSTFYQALESSHVFPKYALNLVRIGEESGNLEEVMYSLAFHYEREQAIADGIKNAVTYPFIIIGMMAIVILVLIFKVLPIFQDVFNELGADLTGLSRGLLNIGNTISNYSIVFVVILIAAIILYFFFMHTKPGRRFLGKFLAVFLPTKNLAEMIATGRFASGMSLTISAGMDFTEGLKMASELSDNPGLSKKIEECLKLIDEGTSYTDALAKSNIFGSLHSHMLTVGDKTGCTEKVLRKIARSIADETDTKISNFIGILEPTLVIVLSVIICLILLSVMLPLMAVLSGML